MNSNKNQPHDGQGRADTGNASNPSPDSGVSIPKEQLIDEKGEKYLREVASIEDLPDAADQQEAEEQEDK
jgi:hypothetical protein